MQDTEIGWPNPVNQLVFQISVACRTPRTAPIALTSSGLIAYPGAGVIITSAPVTCQGGGDLTAGDALADHPGEGGQAEREHERERGQCPGQRGPGRPGQRDEAGGARAAGGQRQQPADNQRIEPQHDHDDRDGDQDRHDREVQVYPAGQPGTP